MSHCVIIGGSGFIGRHVVECFVASGRQITVLGRKQERPFGLDKRCTYISGDYGDPKMLGKVLSLGCEVVDLAYATVPKTSFDDPLFDLVSNLPSSVCLLQKCLEVGVAKVLLVSSGGALYGSAHALPITEDHPTNPISPYGITKLAVDRYAMMFHRNHGLPVVIARPANAYGEDQKSGTGQGFVATAIAAILSGDEVEIYGENGTIRDYIHVSDVSAAILAVLDHGTDGAIYNIGTGVGFSNIEIVRILERFAQEDGIEVRTKFLPPRRFDVEANVLDGSKLSHQSGWAPKISLEEGLRRMWNTATFTKQ